MRVTYCKEPFCIMRRRVKHQILMSFLISAGLTGCAQTGVKGSSDSARMARLSKTIRKKQNQLEKVRQENQLLKYKLRGEDHSKVAKKSKKIKMAKTKKVAKAVIDKTIVLDLSNDNLSDQAIYVKALNAYKAKDEKILRNIVRSMVRAHPRSALADNVVYLDGLLLHKKGNYPGSLKVLDMIVKYYPQGDKRVSALYLKGMTFKKLNLNEQANQVFKALIKAYPGSLESQRAKWEVRLLEEGLS